MLSVRNTPYAVCIGSYIIDLIIRAAALTLRTVLLSLLALMQDPEPNDPQDAVVAKQYKENRHIFRQTAKFWAQVYANGKFLFLRLARNFVTDMCGYSSRQ